MLSFVFFVIVFVNQQQQQQQQQRHLLAHLQSNDTRVYRVQNIRNRINIRSVTWVSMLFEGGNPSLMPKYCQS